MLSKSVILLASGALAGCSAPQVGGVSTAGNEPPASPVDPSAAANVDKNLARLKALDVFEVGELIVDPPANAYACAGPCAGSAPAIDEAKTRAAVRALPASRVATTKTYAPVWRSANCPGSTATTGTSDGMAIVCEAADLPFVY